jgi:serine/threonine-protein kinase
VVEYLVSLFDTASPDKIGTRLISPVELVDSGLREVRRSLADQPRARARLLAALGEIYAKLGKAESAIAALEEAVALEREQAEPNQLPEYLRILGAVLNMTERNGLAAARLREAAALLERGTSVNPGQMADLLTSRSLALARTGQIVAAIEDAERAVGYAERASGVPSKRSGGAYNALSEAYARDGDLERAQKVAELNVAGLESLVDDDEPRLIAQAILAMILAERGQREEAEVLLRGVLEERLKTLDAGSDWIVVLRNQLAWILLPQGRPFEAIALFRENRDAKKSRGETATPAYAITLNNLGTTLDQVGDYEGAEPFLREALRLAIAENDPTSSSEDIFRQNLGRTLMYGGKCAEALPLLEHEVMDDGTDERRFSRLRRLVHLAEWHRRNRNPESARSYIEQAEANVRAVFGAEHARAGGVVHIRALIDRDRGDLAAAERNMQRALQLTEHASQPGAADSRRTCRHPACARQSRCCLRKYRSEPCRHLFEVQTRFADLRPVRAAGGRARYPDWIAGTDGRVSSARSAAMSEKRERGCPFPRLRGKVPQAEGGRARRSRACSCSCFHPTERTKRPLMGTSNNPIFVIPAVFNGEAGQAGSAS